jgi:hypothetical protein
VDTTKTDVNVRFGQARSVRSISCVDARFDPEKFEAFDVSPLPRGSGAI